MSAYNGNLYKKERSMLQGICTPVCTPFSGPHQELDEDAFAKHIDRVVASGVHIVAVCGGTGEFAFLTGGERLRMAEIAAKRVKGKAKLIVQTSGIRTQDAVSFSKHAEELGADALLILPPYFEGPDVEGVVWHYEQISEAVKTPIMVYNIPVHSGFDVTPEVYKRLSAIPAVQYIKDSTGDMMRTEQLIAQGANVFCGCDFLAPYALISGALGCFWGGSNFMPNEAVRLYNLYKEGNYAELFTLWSKMKASNIFLWTTNYNSAVKAAARIRGNDLGTCRLPVQPLGEAALKELEAALKPLLP